MVPWIGAARSRLSRMAPRARSVVETERSDAVPSGNRAGVSTALCRAKTPGVGSGPGCCAGVGVTLHPVHHQLVLAALLGQPLAVRQHHGTESGGDQQRRRGLEGEHVPVEDQRGQALDVAAFGRVGAGQTQRLADDGVAGGEDHQRTEADAGQRGERTLTLDRLHQRVGGVHADQHQHEQEQHQDRAGVDDDLHGEQERRVKRRVLHGQGDHHRGQAERGVHRLAGQDHPQRRQHHHRGQQPERDLCPDTGLARPIVAVAASPDSPCSSPAARSR